MPSAESLADRDGARDRWLVTATVLLSSVSVILSTTIVNVVIPDVMGAFGIDQTKAQWLSTGFLAAMTPTMLLTDWAQRALGERGTVTAMMLLFVVSSVVGGSAGDENVLILARVLQGAAAGIIQPLAMVIIFQVFPPDKRGSAMGIYGIGVVLAPALGPWIGGLLVDEFGWRSVFYLGIPPALLALVLANVYLPGRRPTAAPAAFDWTGFALLTVGLATLLTGLSNGQRWGWHAGPTLATLALGGVAAIAFVGWERRSPRPMLDLRVFASGPFAAACLVSFVLGAGLFGSTYLLPLFVQTVQGYTPTQAGLLLMPAGLVLMLVFPTAGHLSDRLPPPLMVAGGLLVFGWASFLTAGVDVDTGFWSLAGWTMLTRVGMGVVFPAISAGPLRLLEANLMAQGSGALNFTRQLGGAFGVNLLAVLLERQTAHYADVLSASQTYANGATMAFLNGAAELADAGGVTPVEQASSALWLLGRSLQAQASTLAFQACFLITALVFVAALLPTLQMHLALRRARAR